MPNNCPLELKEIGKPFCSEKCVYQFKEDNSVQCSDCKKILLRPHCIVNDGYWFCNNACVAHLEHELEIEAKDIPDPAYNTNIPIFSESDEKEIKDSLMEL